jgi:hypothetical protein
MAISGRIKWALLSGFEASSALVGLCGGLGVGKNLEMRERREGGLGGGRLRIDFPGMRMVTAEDDGEPEELEAAMDDDVLSLRFM